jgi:hypothetical protein
MMNVKMSQRIWMTLALTIITLWFLQESIGLSSVASFIPRFMLTLTLFLLIVQLLLDLKEPGGSSPVNAETTDILAGTDRQAVRRISVWLVILWITVLPAAVWLFGVMVGGSLFCLVFMRWYAFETWKISLVFAITLGLAVQLVFSVILNITLYSGVIEQVLA